MEIVKHVTKKIAMDELCEICVEGGLVRDTFVKSTQYICLIERQGDHALFMYNCMKRPCVSENDLTLDKTVAVDGDLRILAEPPPKDRPVSQAPFLFGLQTKDEKHLYELPQDSHTSKFLAEIKQAKALQSQNAGFGLPSSFSWLEKYSQKAGTSSSAGTNGGGGGGNPFATDVFDPMKYMQLETSKPEVTSGLVRTDQARSSKTNSTGSTWYEDSFAENSLDKKRSGSKDSLDDILREKSEMTESLDEIQSKLGLAQGEEGLKPTSARETLVAHFLNKRENEFVDIAPLKLFCGTWNVNGQIPGNLSEWLACDKDPPDIYALGFQELDLSSQAYIFSDSNREQEWQTAVRKYLHPKAKYRKVKSLRLVGVLLIVYVNDNLTGNISLIDSESVPTGIMGFMGNKGGVGVRLTIHNTTLCFVNSHLAAHQDEFDRRNQDTKDIETRMSFKQFLPPLTIPDHDMVFWLGDLNYRIDMEINTVKEFIRKGLYQKLLPQDQLYTQMSTNPVYQTYTEGEINFAPTYKYDPGTDDFDTSEKSRIPAYCDRILWKGQGVRQVIYRSHPTLRISDHKPVSSIFQLGVKVVDNDRYKKVYEDIMKQLDRMENDFLPTVALTQREFFFKDVRFIEPQSQILAIANTGQIPVTFEFINKPNEASFCKSWLTVSPSKAVITPGDSCELTMEVFVDKSNAMQLNSGEEKIDDILVLHLHGGKDFFIPISGNYIPSSFGSSIEALIQMHGPIRQVPEASLLDLERPGSLNKVDVMAAGTKLYVCPKEIYRLVDHIYKYGRDQEDLFLQPGLNPEIQQIRECLDTGVPEMIPGSIHSVTEAFLLFLEALPEPVIPYSFYQRCLECSNNFLLCKQVLSQVPDCHRNVFKYTCALLRELLQHSQHNNLEIRFLASMFGDLFLRGPGLGVGEDAPTRRLRRQQVRSEEVKKAAFVYHFLANEYDE